MESDSTSHGRSAVRASARQAVYTDGGGGHTDRGGGRTDGPPTLWDGNAQLTPRGACFCGISSCGLSSDPRSQWQTRQVPQHLVLQPDSPDPPHPCQGPAPTLQRVPMPRSEGTFQPSTPVSVTERSAGKRRVAMDVCCQEAAGHHQLRWGAQMGRSQRGRREAPEITPPATGGPATVG